MLNSFFLNYRIATGTYLLTKTERRIWDVIFITLFVLFTIGLIDLSINTYRSFARLLWGSGTQTIKKFWFLNDDTQTNE